MVDRSRTKTSRGNRTPNGQPDQTADPDTDPVVAVAHWHGHAADLHVHGGEAHYMGEDGHPVFGSWDPPGTAPFELVPEGDYLDDHRHDGTSISHHEQGRDPHKHAAIGGHRLPIPPEEEQPTQVVVAINPGTPAVTTPEGATPAEVEASQGRHPASRDLNPEEVEQLKAEHRAALDRLTAVPSPPPLPPRPVPAAASPAAGRLGTDLGGLELVKAGFRAMFPGAPDGLDQEWALTMGASDLLGQILNQHRRPAFADPGLIAGLRALAEQLDDAAAAREAR